MEKPVQMQKLTLLTFKCWDFTRISAPAFNKCLHVQLFIFYHTLAIFFFLLTIDDNSKNFPVPKLWENPKMALIVSLV